MSTEPLVAIQPVFAFDRTDPEVTTSYLCKVTIDQQREVHLEFIFTGGIEPDQEAPAVLSGGTTRIDFVIEKSEYRFPSFNPLCWSHDTGPFLWDFSEGSPLAQVEADFRIPPALRVEIGEDRQSARMTVTNRFIHEWPYRYSLRVGVVSRLHRDKGEVLISEDPTLIEDPFEGHGELDPPLSRS